jgi:hypothetical protein
LMKCYICLAYYEKEKVYPEGNFLKNCGGHRGHDLGKLEDTILKSYFGTNNVEALNDDYDFLTKDQDLKKLLSILTEFGEGARYYNLDVVTGNSQAIDAKILWDNLEISILDTDSELLKKTTDLELRDEASATVTRQIIIKLERFVRALSRQFILGRLGKKAKQFSPALNQFSMLPDSELGCRDYRKETTSYSDKVRKVHKRTIIDEVCRKLNINCRHRLIKKEEFEGEWPFYHNSVIIECRKKHWCIVTIEGNDYALTGNAKARYKLEDVHEGGMAILGKSIQPFIDMALKLWDK